MLPGTRGTQLHSQASAVRIRLATISMHTPGRCTSSRLEIALGNHALGVRDVGVATRARLAGDRCGLGRGGKRRRRLGRRQSGSADRHELPIVAAGGRCRGRGARCRRPARRTCDAHTPVTDACGYGKMASTYAARAASNKLLYCARIRKQWAAQHILHARTSNAAKRCWKALP